MRIKVMQEGTNWVLIYLQLSIPRGLNLGTVEDVMGALGVYMDVQRVGFSMLPL